MTNVRMVYLLEEETQLHLIQLRDHLKLLSLLASPRFRKYEHHSLPVPLQPLSSHAPPRWWTMPCPRRIGTDPM